MVNREPYTAGIFGADRSEESRSATRESSAKTLGFLIESHTDKLTEGEIHRATERDRGRKRALVMIMEVVCILVPV